MSLTGDQSYVPFASTLSLLQANVCPSPETIVTSLLPAPGVVMRAQEAQRENRVVNYIRLKYCVFSLLNRSKICDSKLLSVDEIALSLST